MDEKPKDVSELLARVKKLKKELDEGDEAFKVLVERSKKVPQELLHTVKESKIIRDFLAKTQADKMEEGGVDDD